MREQLAALYELQHLDVKITQTNAALTALSGAKTLKQQLAAATKSVEAAEQKLSAVETEAQDGDLELKSVDEKRGRAEKRLYGGAVSNPRELQALEKEVTQLKEQQSKLDGRALELMDMVEQARTEARSARQVVGDLQSKIDEALKTESAERKRLEKELAEAESKRSDAAAIITNKQLMARYEAVRKRTGSTGLAKVVRGQCEGCNVSVTLFTLRRLEAGEGFDLCENCGRILMLDMG